MALFEKGNSTRCDWCGDDLSTSEALDWHEGKHRGADPQAFKVGFMQHKKFRRHAEVCQCSECKRVRQMVEDQKREYWATLHAA